MTALACLNSTTVAAGTQARIRMCGGGQLEIGGRHTSPPLGEQTHAPPCAIGETDRYGLNTPQDESFLTWLGDVTISNGMTTDTYGHTDLTTAIL